MSDDWKGEALIRGVRLSGAEKRAESSRLGVVVGKHRGSWLVPLETRKRHGALVKSALRYVNVKQPAP